MSDTDPLAAMIRSACQRMAGLLADADLDISPRHVARMWQAYSESLCAGWLIGLESMSAEAFVELARGEGLWHAAFQRECDPYEYDLRVTT